KGAFSVVNNLKIKGKKIVLVDDVITTGSTMLECIKTLKEAGAKEVVALSAALAV
ncbi:MAG: ComF family protein, partial [Candidatus Marinimicrobia bacterium]|nr:ComF family protein [Candidatus Neomarinimicrobiota bacterium]